MLTILVLLLLSVQQQESDYEREQMRRLHQQVIEQLLRNPPPKEPEFVDEWTWKYNAMIRTWKKFHSDLEKGKFDKKQLDNFFKKV